MGIACGAVLMCNNAGTHITGCNMAGGAGYRAVEVTMDTSLSGNIPSGNYVTSGAACPGGTSGVVMSVSDYNALRTASSEVNVQPVVDQIVASQNILFVGALAVVFLLAFAFGWRIGHGGRS